MSCGLAKTGLMIPASPYSRVHPESSANPTACHSHARNRRGRLHDLDALHLMPLLQRQLPDDRAGAI